jgi:putative transposase
MACQGLAGWVKKRRKGLTRPDERKRPFPDLVKGDFTEPAPNLTWCGDITEIPTDEGKLYLSVTWNQPCVSLPGVAGLAR